MNFHRIKTFESTKDKFKDVFFGKKSIKSLPDNFFEKILDAEMKLKTGFSMDVLQELINYYTIAIEYYESHNDERYKRYSQSLNLLLAQPEVLKHITMQTKNGKIKVMKEERKKAVFNEIEKVDKNNVKQEAQKLINAQNDYKKKEEEANRLINNDLNEQNNNFKKRLEAKKKRIKLNKSDIENFEVLDKKIKKEKKKTNLNDSFEKTEEKENIFGIDIEPINNITNENNINLTELINSKLEFFYSEFDSLFSEQITQKFINEVSKLQNKKHNELIELCEKYATLIKENECKLTLPENDDIEKKQKIGDIIYQLGIEENEKKLSIEKKYKEKFNKLKKDMKEKTINNFNWVKKLKEKYINDIEETLQNYNFQNN
jgi:hypothetical protein